MDLNKLKELRRLLDEFKTSEYVNVLEYAKHSRELEEYATENLRLLDEAWINIAKLGTIRTIEIDKIKLKCSYNVEVRYKKLDMTLGTYVFCYITNEDLKKELGKDIIYLTQYQDLERIISDATYKIAQEKLTKIDIEEVPGGIDMDVNARQDELEADDIELGYIDCEELDWEYNE